MCAAKRQHLLSDSEIQAVFDLMEIGCEDAREKIRRQCRVKGVADHRQNVIGDQALHSTETTDQEH